MKGAVKTAPFFAFKHIGSSQRLRMLGQRRAVF
jgi:hypothetical protein